MSLRTEYHMGQVCIPAKDLLPEALRTLLAGLQAELGGSLYLGGGAVRDALLDRPPSDIDLTLASGVDSWAERLAARSGGTCVPLGRGEETTRIAGGDVTADLTAFRQGAQTIEEELRLRDLRVNALAVCLDPLLQASSDQTEKIFLPVIDPTGGLDDLENKKIQATDEAAFRADPLRLLRVFRFAAELDFTISPQTLAQVTELTPLIAHSAAERQAYEMDLIMQSPRSHATIQVMATSGLLWVLLPELKSGRSMAQPKSHHLDVWGHSLEALRAMEELIANPEAAFPGERSMAGFVYDRRHARLLKWAALLHDLGKPPSFAMHPEKPGKITFYNHDQLGAEHFCRLAARLHWSLRDTDFVARLIHLHMQPFHLANVARKQVLSLRAQIRALRRADTLLPGLFLLAMADSLAGQGEERVPDMEAELAHLYHQLEEVRLARVEPVKIATPLLGGHDLIAELGLAPGPIFKKILAEIEEARMEGQCATRDEALLLAKKIANPKNTPNR